MLEEVVVDDVLVEILLVVEVDRVVVVELDVVVEEVDVLVDVLVD